MSDGIEWQDGLEFTIDPNATLSYSFNWADWLPVGAGIASYTIVYDADDVTVEADSEDAGIVSVLVSGVALGARAELTCRITTDESAAQTDDRSIILVGTQK